MIEIKITGASTEEVREQLLSLAESWENEPSVVPLSVVGVDFAEEGTEPVTVTQVAPTPAGTRGRGRPPGAKNKKTVCTLPAEPAPAPTGPPSEACCDTHALVLSEGTIQLKGEGCRRCDEAIKKAAQANPVPVPAPKPGEPVDLAPTVKAKMREWIIAANVGPEALTAWILGYGAADLRGIDPAKHPAMIADLDAKIGPTGKIATPAPAVKADPLA